ncbi:exosortase A [Betaproteobacteria bacterium]|nr:exosortase A [Betaproteobacteria bacterium]
MNKVDLASPPSLLLAPSRSAAWFVPPGFSLVALTLLGVLLWNLALFWRTAGEIAWIWWRSDTFAHGLVVLPVFAWLVWRKREAIGDLRPQPLPWLALPLAGAGFMWLLGEVALVAAAAHTGFVLMVVTGMVAALGWRLARVLLFPLAFLFFGLPVGEFLLPGLMRMTADFTVFSLRLVGVPVYQEGLQFVIPNGRWSVVEACSGIRYLIASLMLGALYAWLNYTRLKKRLAFMLVALLAPVLANWLRAWMIVMLGYWSDNTLAAGVDHLIYGWVFFGLVILCMFMIGQRWVDVVPVVQAAAPALDSSAGTSASVRWAKLAPLALVSVALVLAHGGLVREGGPFTVDYALFAPGAGWTEENAEAIPYRAHYAGSRGEAVAAYGAADGNVVLLQTAYYAAQGEGANLVTWGNGFVAGDDPNRSAFLRQTETESALGTVTSARLKVGERVFQLWRWYVVGGKVVSRDWEFKLRLALERLAGRGDAAMVFVLASPENGLEDDGGERSATARLGRFVADHALALGGVFAAVAAKGAP